MSEQLCVVDAVECPGCHAVFILKQVAQTTIVNPNEEWVDLVEFSALSTCPDCDTPFTVDSIIRPTAAELEAQLDAAKAE